MKSILFDFKSSLNCLCLSNYIEVLKKQLQSDDVCLFITSFFENIGNTDYLLRSDSDKNSIDKKLFKYEESIKKTVKLFQPYLNKDCINELVNMVNLYIDDIKTVFKTFYRYQTLSDTLTDLLVHKQNVLTGELFKCILQDLNLNTELIDVSNCIFWDSNIKDLKLNYGRSQEAARNILNNKTGNKKIFLFSDFSCSSEFRSNIKISEILKKSGIEYTCALISAFLNIKYVDYYIPNGGIYTAPKNIVKDAKLIKWLSFDEFCEFSNLGIMDVNHETASFFKQKNIEIRINDILKIENPSTIISNNPIYNKNELIKGITYQENIAIISVTGVLIKRNSSAVRRIFSTVADLEVSILFISQSSSEQTVSFGINLCYADLIYQKLLSVFRFEFEQLLLSAIEVSKNVCIILAIGNNMDNNRGIAGKIFSAIASRNINVKSISQDSNERSISIAIDKKDLENAVQYLSHVFFNTMLDIEIFLFGIGTIGSCLLNIIKNQKYQFLQYGYNLKVIGISRSKVMLIDNKGIELSDWRNRFDHEAVSFDCSNIDYIINYEYRKYNSIFIDCTTSPEVAEKYVSLLENGYNIITANKKANSMNYEYYKKIRATADEKKLKFLYETNVGAGLPIIYTLQSIYARGDEIKSFYGIMSGSLSFIFGKLEEGYSFSEAVFEAKKIGFTEPDPRDDLNGMDIARKGLIIARECKNKLELSDVTIQSIFPKDFDLSGTTDEFLRKLPQIDEYFQQRINKLKINKQVLKMAVVYENNQVSVKLLEVDENHPLYNIKNGENAFVFYTKNCKEIPITVQGYGAGAEVTATGMYGDLCRILNSYK